MEDISINNLFVIGYFGEGNLDKMYDALFSNIPLCLATFYC